MRKQKGGFTLVELLVAIAILATLVFFVARLLDSATTVTTLGNKRMDADSQARQFLSRIGTDLAQMVKRTDVSYYVKTGARQMGNDQIAFFSAVPGYYPQSGFKSGFSLVAYRVNADPASPSYNRAQRMGKGLHFTGAYANAVPLLFFDAVTPNTTIKIVWPTATNAAASDNDYELIGPQIFRFEYYYLLKTGALSTGPWADENSFAIKDVAALVVAIAVIDQNSAVLLSNTGPTSQIATLGARLPDFSDEMKTGELLTSWQTALDNTADMPRLVVSPIRLYERYFSLSQ